MTGQKAHSMGDINLASALAAIGIPPSQREPFQLVSSETGTYARFRMMDVSIDGRHDAEAMMRAWSNPASLKESQPSHPFVLVMDFIQSKPREYGYFDGWMQHAAEFLEISVDEMHKAFKQAEQTCADAPESPLSYIVAFIHARESLIEVAKVARRNGDFSNLIEKGKSIAMISNRLAPATQKHLLERIQ